jgi:hypothetical protein
MKRWCKDLCHFFVFLLIANLPFLTMACLLGPETFLDSFDHPASYVLLNPDDDVGQLNITAGTFFLVQRSSHPDFTIEPHDIILYCHDDGTIDCDQISHLTITGSIRQYALQGTQHATDTQIIYDDHIIGKIVGHFDANLWNNLALSIWDAAVNNLNIHNLLPLP